MRCTVLEYKGGDERFGYEVADSAGYGLGVLSGMKYTGIPNCGGKVGGWPPLLWKLPSYMVVEVC